jgi:hypothetical protein
MPKYVIRQSGNSLSCVGDNQQVTITQTGEQAVKTVRPGRNPMPGTSGQVRAIGRGAKVKVFVNGKRVQ